MKQKKLVLFDIDGTLIYHVPTKTNVSYARFVYAIQKTFGVDVEIDTTKNYNGWVDLQITADIVQPYGISKETVMRNSSVFADALHDYVTKLSESNEKLYVAIPEAVQLACLLNERKFYIGLLTGNVKRMAQWKLEHAEVPHIFTFGLFGDDVDDRILLAKTVFKKAKNHFGVLFLPKNIFVVGDAIGDIRCGKAIGATTIIATTGRHSSQVELAVAKPDLLVDSLMDERVLSLLGLEK